MNRKLRQSVVAAAVGALVVTAAVAGVTTAGTPKPAAPSAGEGAPGALGQHLEQVRRAVPGNAGMAEEGPGSAAEAAFLERAYPADTISVGKVQSSQRTFQRVMAATRQADERQLAPG
ncbi:MAG: hypothetical protein M3Q87_01785, partial [Actinomycetota bacterium]|nr:hypothetical protein [Actinomycetota bacterium]